MRLTILYFARLREALGIGRESVETPPEVATLAQLRAWLCARDAHWARAFEEIVPIRVALDQEVRNDDAPLHEGAEVAFFPPVTGG